MGHSISGDAPKIRVSALRAAKHVYKFVPNDADAGAMIQQASSSLDYTKLCWVLRIEGQKLVPASLGLLNMKARVFECTMWTPLTKPTAADAMEVEEGDVEAEGGRVSGDDMD